MESLKIKHFLSLLVALPLLFSACGGSDDASDNSGEAKTYESKVVEFSLSDPDMLNPYNAQGEQITYIGYQVWQPLLSYDFKTYEMVPVLAKERPVLQEDENGKLVMDFEIREAAAWDNGEPITGHDIVFSMKVMKNPKVDNLQRRVYLEFVEDVVVDAENPKKFRVVCKEPYMIAEGAMEELKVLPEYVYDPEGLMKEFTIPDLTFKSKELESNETIQKYAEFFNGEKFQREVAVGSGPYSFVSWETNQRVTFKLKENWWGHQYKEENTWFEANNKKLVYETINDKTTALVALKGEKIDVMKSIEYKDFVQDLPKSEKFNKNFNAVTPPLFSYDYVGINTKLEKFGDVNTRKALAHMIDIPKLIETTCYGLGEQVTGIIHPSITKFLNTDIVAYEYSIEKAKELLKAGGWEDTNGDGTVDKVINGERIEFEININYNTGNDRRKNTCLFFMEGARRAGVKVNVLPLDWSKFLERTKAHDFEMYVGGWISSPAESDIKQIWHTESYNGGSNYVGFGNAKTDAMIDELRKELDESKRAQIYKDFQQILHDEVPYIFLMARKEAIAIHKKYDNAYGTGMRPGYWTNGFSVKAAVN